MNLVDLLGSFINMQIFGTSLILIGIGNMMVKHFGCNRKKIPQLFVLISVPLTLLYNLCSNPEVHIVVTVMDSVFQSVFSCTLAMGFYDLGKSLWKSIKYQFKKSNPASRKQEEDM